MESDLKSETVCKGGWEPLILVGNFYVKSSSLLVFFFSIVFLLETWCLFYGMSICLARTVLKEKNLLNQQFPVIRHGIQRQARDE